MSDENKHRRLDDLVTEHRICREKQDTRWTAHQELHQTMIADRKTTNRFYIVLVITIFAQIFLTIWLHYYG